MADLNHLLTTLKQHQTSRQASVQIFSPCIQLLQKILLEVIKLFINLCIVAAAFSQRTTEHNRRLGNHLSILGSFLPLLLLFLSLNASLPPVF